MKISIVIPAHNEEASLGETLKAALAQDYGDYEVIVVDNASSDRTAEIASRFPVRLVREGRKGLLWAREAGRRAATGEIVANMDADCLPESDWLSRAAGHFGDGRTVAVTGPYDYHDGGRVFRTISLLTQRHGYRAMSLVFQSPIIRNGAVMIGGNNMIRAEILERMGGYNTALTFYGEDTDTAKRVSAHGRIVFDPDLSMKTSARRFKSEGTVRLTLKYWFYFLKHIFMPRRKNPPGRKNS